MINDRQKMVLKELANRLSKMKIRGSMNIMEVCGTHTTEYFKSGIRDVFPKGLKLIDGPGCPVCVTTNDYLDRAIQIGIDYNAVLTTFGDLMRVPSSYSSLLSEKAKGMDVRVVYSPFDALQIAVNEPKKQVVFLSVGFETTLPLEAIALQKAKELNLNNFSMLIGNKRTPPAVEALLNNGDVPIDGFILPGHVSTIIGVDVWQFVSKEFSKPAVVAGFMRRHLLTGTAKLVEMIENREIEIFNDYPEAVKNEGNVKAQNTVSSVFVGCDSVWRGIGMIEDSGFELRPEFSRFDSRQRYPVDLPESREDRGCKCGEILTGKIQPPDCPLFGKKCTPQNPVGACMVSYEGACAAYYKYSR